MTLWAREHALKIFTECANSGHDFAACLSAIFVTGLHYATEVSKTTVELDPQQTSMKQFFEETRYDNL